MKDFLRTKRKPVCVYLRRLFWLIIFFTAGPAVTAQSEDEPLSISADYISRNNKTGETTANGNVIIKQKDIIIYGDKATLNETDRTSNVAGNVKLILPDVEIEASRINLNIDTNFGSMEDASGRTADGFVFTGRKIQKVTKDRYLIWDGTFTTCQEDEPDWIFKSGFTSLDIDNMVWLRDVSFYFFDLPLAYAPLWGAPAATKRTTGLLGPTFGVSSVNGTYINNTFFWAKSDSEDVSYYFDYMDLRGFRHGLEYRYAFAEKTRGQLNYNYIYDQRLEENLWNVKYHHRQKFKNGADSRARFDYESETSYSKEFGSGINLFSMRYTDSYVNFTKNTTDTAISFTVRDQKSIESATKRRFTRQPEIRMVRMSHELFGTPFVANLPLVATSFRNEKIVPADPETDTEKTKTEDTINRLDIRPTLSLPFSPSRAFNVTPFVSYRLTHYSRNAQKRERPITVEYYTAGASLEGPRAYRAFKAERWALKHTITPKMDYKFIPGYEIDGEDRQLVPQIDSRDNSSPANNLRFSILQRLLHKTKEQTVGRQIVRLEMMQSYNINEANRKDAEWVDRRPLSKLRVDLDTNPFGWLLLNVDLTQNHYNGMMEKMTQEVGLLLGKWAYVSYDRLYAREPKTVSSKGLVGFKMHGGFSFEASAIHDDVNQIYSNSMLEMKYESDCWGLALTVEGRRRIEELDNGNVRDEWEQRLYLVLSLKGIGEAGAKPKTLAGRKL